MIKGLDSYVYLRPEDHQYFDRDGRRYESVSAFRARFKKPFDRSIAFNCAGKGEYEGMTADQVLAHWDQNRDNRAGIGTNFHDALERFEKTSVILPEDEHLRPAILSILSEYSGYHRVYQEQVLYDTEHMIAGTADKVCVTSQYHDSVLDLTDFKTNAKEVHVKDIDKHGKLQHKYFLHCLSHLLESKYSDYSLQLSTYAYFLEKQTGRRIGSLRIHFIPTEDPLNHFMIPVPYMKFEVMAMLKWRKEHPDTTILTQNPPEKQKSVLQNFGPNNLF